MALGIHLKNMAHVMRTHPGASVIALATLERRGGCEMRLFECGWVPLTSVVRLLLALRAQYHWRVRAFAVHWRPPDECMGTHRVH